MSLQINKLKVIRKEFETPDSVSIYFDLGKEPDKVWSYLPGQYITLKMDFEGFELPLRRAYSLCTNPNSQDFGFCVKRVQDGLVSNYLIDNLEVGDEIDVIPPLGNFTLKDSFLKDQDLVFIAAGSGITPVYSMMSYIQELSAKAINCPRLHLLYVNKTEQDIIFKKSIDGIAKSNLKVVHYLTRYKGDDEAYNKGRIDIKALNQYFREQNIDCYRAQVFVCGPEGLLNTVQSYFRSQELPIERLHFELFNASEGSPVSENQEDNTHYSVKVLLDGEEFNIKVGSKENIIQRMIDENIDAPYTCLNGTCSSCMALKREGDIVIRRTEGLSKEEIEEGFILACQCAPRADNLVVDFDY